MIISLTSFPARIPYISSSLASIVRQTNGDDRIVLWLGDKQFPNRLADIPPDVAAYSTERGGRVEFVFTKDVRSFTKLVPALLAFPDEVVITLDDDVVYAPGTLRALKEAHVKTPNVIFAHGVSDVYRARNRWKRTTGMFGFFYSPKFLRMPLGVGGVLYPPHCLHPIVTDEAKFMRLCPTADDIWFWHCATKQGTPVCRVKYAMRRPQFASCATIGALCSINEVDGDKVNLDSIERLMAQDEDVRNRVFDAIRRHALGVFLARCHRMLFHYPRQLVYCLRVGGVRFLLNQLKTAV